MPSLPFNDFNETISSKYSKSDIMLGEEEEEIATLAEPMTVEGAKHLAQSNGVTHSQTPSASLSMCPTAHVLPIVSPPLLSAPRIMQPILNVPALVSSRNSNHVPLTLPSGTLPHSLLIPGHLPSSPSQFPVLNTALWAPPAISHEEDEMSDYPSTVDLQAIRDSPSPQLQPNKQTVRNENWDSQDIASIKRNSNHGEDSSSDEDESDSSDSDSSDSTSQSSDMSNEPYIPEAVHNKTPNITCSKLESNAIFGSDISSSDNNCKQTDSECDSSSDESISSHIRDEQHKVLARVKPQLTANHLIEQIISKREPSITETKQCTLSKFVGNGSSKSPIYEQTKSVNAEMEKLSAPTYSSGAKSDKAQKKNTCHPSKCQRPNSLREKNLLHSKPVLPTTSEVKETNSVVPKRPVQPKVCSTTELEERRMAKKKEMDQEFDRLLEDATKSQPTKEIISRQKVQLSTETSHVIDALQTVQLNSPTSLKSNEKANNQFTKGKKWKNDVLSEQAPKKSSLNLTDDIESGDECCVASATDTNEPLKISQKPTCDQSFDKQMPIPGNVKQTIADTVKIRERRTSFDSVSSNSEKGTDISLPKSCCEKQVDRSVEEDASSLSDTSEELNEKVDLDTEQTQTFSVSENNFNQGRLTMKIAAMKLAKFGKTGLREVTGGGFPTRSDCYGPFDYADTVPARYLLKELHGPKYETQKVKTAAERKTYVDALPVTSNLTSNCKKKNPKEPMRVSVSTFHRSLSSPGKHKVHPDGSASINDLERISAYHLGEGLQILNQDDLTALLTDDTSHHNSNSVLYSFKENARMHQTHETELPDVIVQEAIKSMLTPDTSMTLNSFLSEKSAEAAKSGNYRKTVVKCQHEVCCEKEHQTQSVHDVESYMPLDHNASSVSPDSGIQSVNGSPLHPVGSPHHPSPFYSSGLIGAGISASNCSVSESTAPPEVSLSGSFSESYIHRDSPSPPTLVPAVTPPHLCRSPRYYSDGPDSPPMPSLKCQVDPPPWQVERDCILQAEAALEDDVVKECKPKRSRGRPKGSKSKSNHANGIWSTEAKDSCAQTNGDDEAMSSHSGVSSPLVKRRPGRPKKVRNPADHISPCSKVKRPVGRPRKQPFSDDVENNKCLPVTLASRKCFSEKIMHKIINENVRSSEKSDKLAIGHQDDDMPSQIHDSKDKRSEDERGRKTKRKGTANSIKLSGEGIPLVEERKKKRGRRKELPAIFEKVYGTVKSCDRVEACRGLSPASHSGLKRKKKHKKLFKSKHKNIIDPVFLAELENLLCEFHRKCVISKPLVDVVNSKVFLPSIFRTRKVNFSAKKKRVDKVKSNDKENNLEGETRDKLPGKRKKKVQEPPKQGRERSDASEQRLPLKKRHRHMSTGVSVCCDVPKMESPKAGESKEKSTFESTKTIKAEAKLLKCNLESKIDSPQHSRKKVESKCKENFETNIEDGVLVAESFPCTHEGLKNDTTYQSMLPTTPKKRHRLEADICAKAIEHSTDHYQVTLVNHAPASSLIRTVVKEESGCDLPTTANKLCVVELAQPNPTSAEDNAQGNIEDTTIHSDSDIPSEHELLGESDQSGFMSDKESSKQDEPAIEPSKRKKKRRERRSPKKLVLEKPKEILRITANPPTHKKKRRKTNRTGFPTVKKRKKVKLEFKKDGAQGDSPVVLTSDQAASIDPKVCIEPLLFPLKLCKDSQQRDTTRPRGRPKKYPEESRICQVDEFFRCRKRREFGGCDEDTKLAESKRSRRLAEDEVEDSDVLEFPISSEPTSSDESSKAVKIKQKVPRFKKKYLVAGLLSSYYKQDECDRKNGETCGRPKSVYEPQQHIHGLLPPPSYCKKQLRETQIDFALPYDLWWLHKHNRLPGRDLVPSWNYKKVKANVYYDVKPTHEFDIQACNCKKPAKPDEKSCGDDCINRMMFIECSPQTCPENETCSNQRLQRHENLTCLQKFMTLDKGWGMKSTADIKQGTFIMEYVGEVVSEREFRYRMQTRYVNDTHHYCLNLDRGMMIDGHRIGSDCRFVNHSCAPNCEMQKWNVNGQYRMALFALADIKPSEELTYDYNFHLFNPAQGQPCKCQSQNCRGVIGGRSQRVNIVTEEKRKSGRNKKEVSRKRKRGTSTDTDGSCVSRAQFMPLKPLSHQQRLFILSHRCFLIRNLEKIRKTRDIVARYHEKAVDDVVEPAEEPCNKKQRFLTHFIALNTARSVKTRRLAQAQDDPEMTRLAKLAQIFKDIVDKLVASRDDKDKPLATPFRTVPHKRKCPTYHSRIGQPIALTDIENKISTGHYQSIEDFDSDVMKLFANNLRFFGRNTEIGQMAVGLRKVYSECKLQFKPLLEEVLGEDHLPPAFADCVINEEFEDEDVIRCVCNLYRDEGTMIQCERCLVWQHCDCMCVDEDNFPEHYHCEECSPRIVSPEVPMTPQPADSNNKKHFITLLRDNLQIKQGDSVYILRDRPVQKAGERRQCAYKLAKDLKLHQLLIFKVESLFIDEKGDKYAFGHHYLRPHETFHEPMRKFYSNEVIRSPYCEILALDMIIRHCWVMDLNSYCRGRPIGAIEEHVYVCEFRVDKSARVFSKISKPKYPICKKPYAFITFPEKLRPQKTYTPHEVIFSRRSKQKSEKIAVKEEKVLSVGCDSAPGTATSSSRNSSANRKSQSNSSSVERSEMEPVNDEPVQFNKHNLSKKVRKQMRVNELATRLLHRLPTKGAVDLAYLLENSKRQRKKTTAFAS